MSVAACNQDSRKSFTKSLVNQEQSKAEQSRANEKKPFVRGTASEYLNSVKLISQPKQDLTTPGDLFSTKSEELLIALPTKEMEIFSPTIINNLKIIWKYKREKAETKLQFWWP